MRLSALLPSLVLVLTPILLVAEDPPPAPASAPPVTQPPTTPPAAKPFLGIQVDPAKTGSFDSGVGISTVLPNSTAALMGMQNNDIIQAINKQPVASMDDLQKIMATLKLGDTVTVDVLRKGEKLSLSGAMIAKPAPPLPLPLQIKALQEEIDRLKKRADHPPDLAETLDNLVKELNDLQRDLPRASEAFRKLYPNGVFSIKMEIQISSDTTAKNPVVLGNGVDSGGPAPQAPAPAPAPSGTPPAAPGAAAPPAPTPHTP
jgi:membrane-associated protease RseP (regulator of RpoE activity)